MARKNYSEYEQELRDRLARALWENRGLKNFQKDYLEEMSKQELKYLQMENETKKNLSILRHDLRNPLNSMIGFSDLLLTNPDLDENSKRMIKYVNQSSRKFLNLVNFASPSLVSQKEKLNVEEIVREVNSSQNYYMDKNKIGLDLRYSPVETQENRTLITGIMNTLTENALLYSPKLSRIEQGIRKNPSGNLEILLENKIAPERREDLGEGKGIGQGTSRSFVEQMGGKFEIYEGDSKILYNHNKNRYEAVELFGSPKATDRIKENDSIYGVRIVLPIKQ